MLTYLSTVTIIIRLLLFLLRNKSYLCQALAVLGFDADFVLGRDLSAHVTLVADDHDGDLLLCSVLCMQQPDNGNQPY